MGTSKRILYQIVFSIRGRKNTLYKKNIYYRSTPTELSHTRNNSTGYTCGYYCLIPMGFIPAHQNNN